jgi:protein TonB
MNDTSFNLAHAEADESTASPADDFVGDIDVDEDEPASEEPLDDAVAGQWPIHATFDPNEMTGAIRELSAIRNSPRKKNHDRSRFVLAAAISVGCHLGIAALCLAFASAYIFGRTNPRLGGAESQGEYVDSTANTNSDDLPKNESQAAASPSGPTVPPTDVSDQSPAPTNAFNDASNDRQLTEDITPTEPLAMIGLQSGPPAVPNFERRKPAATNADSAVQSSASIPPHSSPQASQSSDNPTSATPSHGHVIGPVRPQGRPGGRRDGFDLDERGIPKPEYPDVSYRRREEGLVKLDLEIVANGTVGRIVVLDDAGYPRLAAAAVASAKTARFNPETCDGRPVICHVVVPYRFTLQ